MSLPAGPSAGSTSTGGNFRISATCWIPLSWRPLPEGVWTPERQESTARSNLKHLHTLLDKETREAPPPELALLESICTEILRCVKSTPTARSVTLAADNVDWMIGYGDPKPSVGNSGLVTMYLDPTLPYEVEFFATVDEVTTSSGSVRVQAHLAPRPQAVQDIYQQLVFIYHRRSQHVKSSMEDRQ